jgi:hypothetical protein
MSIDIDSFPHHSEFLGIKYQVHPGVTDILQNKHLWLK